MKKTPDQWLQAMTEVCNEIDATTTPNPQPPEIKQIEDVEEKLMNSLTEKLDSAVNSALERYKETQPQPQPQPQQQQQPQQQPQPNDDNNNE